MTDAGNTLQTLLDAVAPAVAAARPAPQGTWATVRIFPSPLRAEVVFTDTHGREVALFEASGTPALVDALTAFFNGCLAGMPDDVRRKVTGLLTAGAELVALLDWPLQTAGIALVPSDGRDPVLLAALMPEETRH